MLLHHALNAPHRHTRSPVFFCFSINNERDMNFASGRIRCGRKFARVSAYSFSPLSFRSPISTSYTL